VPNYVQKRPSGYYLRYVIPKPYRHLLIQRELRYPLRVHERRAATQRANIAVAAIERLLDAVRAGVVQLNQEELKRRLRAYVDEQRQRIEDERLERRMTESIRETHESVVVDLLEQYSYALDNADYRLVNTKALAEFIGVPEEQAVSDAEYARARRDWTRAWIDLLRYQLELLRPGGELLDERPAAEPVASTVTAGTRDEPRKDTRTLADWVDAFVENRVRLKEIEAGAKDRYVKAVRDFTEAVGSVPAADITADHVSRYLDFMQSIPADRKKKKAYRDKTNAELLAMDSIPEEDLYSATTINARTQALSLMMEWLRNSHRVVQSDPFSGQMLKERPQQRDSYTEAQLQALFTSALYCPDSAYFRRYGTTSNWWLCLLGLFTGARINELVQLPVTRVCIVDGIHCIDLKNPGLEGLRLKTASAHRLIPIHPELQKLGFMEYVENLRRAGIRRVLPQWPVPTDGRGGKASDWYGRYRDKHFPESKDGKLDFHSFRTTHSTQAATAGVAVSLKRQWLGHAPEDNVTEQHYNTGQPIQMLYDEICRIQFDIPALAAISGQWRELPVKAHEKG
jgi:hypothetical protein